MTLGLRDVRDYRIASGKDPEVIGSSSPFNVAVKSYRLADFTAEQVADLFGQHTAATGQEFTPEAVRLAFEYSQGQPWLVNSLAAEITLEMEIEPPEPITATHLEQARERLILTRATHLDSLTARLGEPRVQRVIEPILAGTQPARDLIYNDDLAYVRDLGLIALDNPVRIANPIYKEVIVRALTFGIQAGITAEPRAFLLPDGRLDFRKILAEFAAWWKLNGEFLAKGEVYHEVAPQLIFMAYLQRVVNGGGSVDREYGIGTGRTDILVRKPRTGPDGRPALQMEAIELKVRTAKTGDPLPEALIQLDGYLSRCGLDSGYLLIFDRRPAAVRQEIQPRFTQETTESGRAVTVLLA